VLLPSRRTAPGSVSHEAPHCRESEGGLMFLGADGSDIWRRECPKCDSELPGLDFEWTRSTRSGAHNSGEYAVHKTRSSERRATSARGEETWLLTK